MSPVEEVSFESNVNSWQMLNSSETSTSPPMTSPAAFDQCTFKRKPGTQVELIAYGLIHPILTIFVVFTNATGIAILIRLRSFTQTNMLLLSIFIADMLTTAVPLPRLFVQYVVNMNLPQIAHYPWCYLRSLSFPVLPVITNNVSIWFVVMLSIQRYTCVWKRDAYDRIFSRKVIAYIIGGITLFTASFHSVLFIDNYRAPLKCKDHDGSEFTICNEDDPSTFLIPDYLETYILSTYYVSRIVIFHLIPIVAITVSTLLLIRILVRAESNRRRLFNRQCDANRQQQAHQSLVKIDEDEQCAIILKANNNNLTRLESNGDHQKNGNGLPKLAASAVSNGTSRLQSARKVTSPSIGRSIDSGSNNNKQKAQRISTTTHMLLIISTIYLVQHIFQSILFVSGVVLNLNHIREPPWLLRAITVQNLVRWACFPANFFLCLYVQAPFRDMFFDMYRGLALCFCKLIGLSSNGHPGVHRHKSDSVTAVTAVEERVSIETLPLMQRNVLTPTPTPPQDSPRKTILPPELEHKLMSKPFVDDDPSSH